MAVKLYCVGYFVICLAAVSAAHDVTSALMRHIERIDGKIETMEIQHRVEIQELDDKLQQQEQETAMLKERLIRVEETNDALKKENDDLRTNMQDNGSDDSDNSSDEDSADTSEKKPQEGIKTDTDEPTQTSTEITRPRKALQDDTRVAFSAYMDHDADAMGPGQTLIYNQILLNDGNGYNKHSGIFTAPVAGVYYFSFVIGQRGAEEEGVALWVNSEHKLDAVAEGYHDRQDLQGGNTAILKLALGDVVLVKNVYGGHVEGADNVRTSTFSGFLLYPADTNIIIVRK